MQLPKYIKIVNYSSIMKLTDYDSYITYGWEPPIKNVVNIDGKFFIKGSMNHLDGCELTPITKNEYDEHDKN